MMFDSRPARARVRPARPRPVAVTAPDADQFALIAARGASGNARALVEPAPPVLPRRFLPTVSSDPGAAVRPGSPGDSAAAVARELSRLRARFRKFESDLAPALPPTRRTESLREADWRLDPAGPWKRVTLPHYGGPIGRAEATYRFEFDVPAARPGEVLFVTFAAVDYRAHVFLNDRYLGSHEGFFAPFEFALTPALRPGRNELLVRVENDFICHGNDSWGQRLDGDKIYAATGPGWDEPGLGWHHCPPGMGIYGAVRLEWRPEIFLHDIFVRPLDLEGGAELWVEVGNTRGAKTDLEIDFAVHGQNFRAASIRAATFGPLAPAGVGVSYYRTTFHLPRVRLWEPDAPWLYQAQVTLRAGECRDVQTRQFGVRTFTQDVASEPRGRFFLNGRSLRLRGANTMGHEQQCVMRDDFDQLREDLLLAKVAHLNFLRLTQRPVQREIYEMCDRLGVMTQTDLPLFGHLRRNQFVEAARQAGEMERMVRGHACNILVSFINEPFPREWGDRSHRNLTRPELESFLDVASQVVRLHNPDRVIKPIDGDYDAPGPGLPDNHCYPGWYNGHGIDLGKLHRGYWIPVKPGWLYACGEYGAEGLDPVALMRRHYPANWLPQPGEAPGDWTPARIARAQTADLQSCWFEEPRGLEQWVEASQEHQRWATRLITEAFRRDNRMVSFAVHLLIDAFPAGWMKTLVDCERRPKPAFYAFRDALTPLMANLRLDRTAFVAGERIVAEAWVCNDRHEIPRNAWLHYQLERAGAVVFANRAPAAIEPDTAVFQGFIGLPAPRVAQRERGRLRLSLRAGGKTLHQTEVAVDLFPKSVRWRKAPPVRVIGGGKAARLADELGCWRGDGGVFLIDDLAAFAARRTEILDAVARGGRAVFLELPPGELDLPGGVVRFEEAGMSPRVFVSRATGHPLIRDFQPDDFRFWHDEDVDRPAPILETLFLAEGWRPILVTGQGGWGQPFKPALAAAERAFGRGSLIVSQVHLAGRVRTNPVARIFAERLCLPPALST